MMAGKSKSGRALKAKPIKKSTQSKVTGVKKERQKKKSNEDEDYAPKEKPKKKPVENVVESVPKEKPMLSLSERLALKRAESTSSLSSVSSEASLPSKTKQTTLSRFGHSLLFLHRDISRIYVTYNNTSHYM